ncbi:hypothetical protein ABVK25_010696 [Lepraria finkii]|uniref:Uncharacterized protein n=1 Tax=Lepraria finkii TaxID=1340010 RepID=A0ABR4ATI7_9LECA
MNTNHRGVLAISTNVPQVLRTESVMLYSIRCSVLIQNGAEFLKSQPQPETQVHAIRREYSKGITTDRSIYESKTSTGTVYATTNLLYSDKGLLTHDPSLSATRPLTKRSKLPTLDHLAKYASAATICCPHTLLKGCPLARCHQQKRWKDYIWVSKATEFQKYYFSTSLVTHPRQRGSARGCRSLPQSGHPSVYHWLRTKHTVRY